MPNNKILIGLFLFVLAIVSACSDEPTAKVVSPEDTIFEAEPVFDHIDEIREGLVEERVGSHVNETSDIGQEAEEQIIKEENQTTAQANGTEEEITVIGEELGEKEEFKFPGTSIVNTKNGISLAIDKIDHEIKGENWGKIIDITATVLNEGNKAFKPKLFVILYDDKDFKEEWFKPKAEIDFDIETLEAGEHITRDAIVNVAFNDINLTKNFKLILTDADDPGNKAKVVVETDFNAIS